MKKSNKVIGVTFCCLKCVAAILSMNMITPAFKIPKSFDDTWTVGSQFPWFGERVTGGVCKVESTTVKFNYGQPILIDKPLNILSFPVQATSRPFHANEIATFLCHSTKPLECPE